MSVTRVQVHDRAVFISPSANTLGKGMYPTNLSPAMVVQLAGAGEYTDCFSAEG